MSDEPKFERPIVDESLDAAIARMRKHRQQRRLFSAQERVDLQRICNVAEQAEIDCRSRDDDIEALRIENAALLAKWDAARAEIEKLRAAPAFTADELNDLEWAICTAYPWTFKSHQPLIAKLQAARAEIEKLRAAPTDAEIEAAAEAMWNDFNSEDSWAKVVATERPGAAAQRRRARLALNAARAVLSTEPSKEK